MKFRRIFRAAAAVLLSAGMLTGCKVRFNTTPWDSDIVAKPTTNISEDLEVTYKEFDQQYRYFLSQYGIEDDTVSNIADACTEQRQNIIDSLILNKIYLKKAAELSVAELTEEEIAQVREDMESQFEEQAKYYGQKAFNEETSASGSGGSGADNQNTSSDVEQSTSSDQSSDSSSDTLSPTDAEILARGYEELDKMLAKCGITRNDLIKWSEDYIKITKLMDEVVKDVTMEAAEERAAEIIKTLEDMYNSDDKYYYFQAGYDRLWVPEGSRRIKHVLLGFNDEMVRKLEALRKEGKDDEADALRTENAAEFSERIAQVEKLLDENVDFNTILLNYSADANSSSVYPDGYLVTRNDDRYVKEFTEAAFAIENVGGRTLCTSDYGVHIMIYASDAKPDEESVKDFTNAVFNNLSQDAVDKQTEVWLAEYNYEIDREKLRIEQQSSSLGS